MYVSSQNWSIVCLKVFEVIKVIFSDWQQSSNSNELIQLSFFKYVIEDRESERERGKVNLPGMPAVH